MPAILSPDKVVLHARPADKAAAIDMVGGLLVAAGHVTPDYVPAMHAREAVASTYLGKGVAVPHGAHDALRFVLSTGIAILHVPDGLDFGGGDTAHLVIGLAARGNAHLDVLTAVAEICSDDARLARLLAADSPAGLIAMLQTSFPA